MFSLFLILFMIVVLCISSILYQSQIRLATADVSVGILEKIQLELDTAATLIKLIYAFMWQEYVLTSSDIFLDPEVGK